MTKKEKRKNHTTNAKQRDKTTFDVCVCNSVESRFTVDQTFQSLIKMQTDYWASQKKIGSNEMNQANPNQLDVAVNQLFACSYE